MKNYLKKIFFILDREEINKLIVIFLLTLICSITELMGIGLIVPILQIFIGDVVKFELPFFNQDFFRSPEKLLIIIMFCFFLIHLIKFYLNKTLIKKHNSFSHNLYAKISKKFLMLYLNKDYNFFVNKNSSELIRNIMGECSQFTIGLVFQILRLVSEIVIFTFIAVFLLFYNFQISLISILLFSLLGIFLIKQNDKKLKFWGQMRQFHSGQAIRQLQQSFGSYRELIINNLIDIFYRQYSHHVEQNAKFGINKDTVTQMPRLILEIVAVFVLVIIISILIIQGNLLSEILVLLGVIFYSTIRLLPSISKMVVSIQNIKYNRPVFDVVYQGLKEYNDFSNKMETNQANDLISFKDFNKIVLDGIDFSYSQDKAIFKKLELTINKSDKIGIIGKTGSGKSTLTNLICGLIKAQKGKIYVDDIKDQKNYELIQKLIGYVPQSVSIFDESVIFNISLKDKLNNEEFKKINEILKILDMLTVVENLPKKHEEKIGEHGSKLSGGQNQRLGIARALFKNPTILILDEATSSLDINTEEEILKNLLKINSDLTIITITHRQTPLKFCDKLYELKDHKLSLIDKKN